MVGYVDIVQKENYNLNGTNETSYFYMGLGVISIDFGSFQIGIPWTLHSIYIVLKFAFFVDYEFFLHHANISTECQLKYAS